MVAGAALVAGGDPWTAAWLGSSMTALQASIGALNDVVDADADRGHKPGKPIAAGAVTPAAGRAVAIGAALIGLGLALSMGPGGLALALAVLVIGYLYDLVAKGTAWSWLPFAIGIPLLPVYGWYGATGSLEPWFLALLPMTGIAGAALAIANARADVERDTAAGTRTIATALGPDRSWAVMAGLWLVVGLVAVVSAIVADGPSMAVGAVLLGMLIVAAGVGLGRGGGAARQRAWEAQAIGAAVAAVGWLLAVA